MADFIPILLEDSRIAKISDKIVYGVQSSGSQSTFQQFQATSSSNSSIVFSCPIPSENILVSRYALLQTKLCFTIAISGVPEDAVAFQYGLSDSLNAFPLHQLCSQMQLTINNCSTSTNVADVLPLLLRLTDTNELNKNCMYTPSFIDSAYGSYKDGIGANNNPLSAFTNAGLDNDYEGRGAFPVDLSVQHFIGGVGSPDTSVISTGESDTWKIVVNCDLTEPFLTLSPFLSCPMATNDAGLLGINQLSIIMNIDATCKRLFSTGNTFIETDNGIPVLKSYIKSIRLGSDAQPSGFTDTKLLLQFLSLAPEQYAKISTKNCVPYLEYPRYISQSNNQSTVLPGATYSFTSNSIQLSVIPDIILICCRVPLSQQTWANTSSFLTINSISVNFNNTSGLLSSCNQVDLFNISKRSGSTQKWNEFRGFSNTNDTSDPPTGGVKRVCTTGSILALNPSNDFNLPSWLACGSLGSFNLQFNVNITNQFDFGIQPELVVVTVQSGVLQTIAGSSSIFTGLLTKEAVLATKAGQHQVADKKEYERLVGGQMCNHGSSNVHHLLERFKVAGGNMSAGAMCGGSSASVKSKLSKLVM